MIISIDTERWLDKIQYLFNKLGMKRNFFNLIKASLTIPPADITLDGEVLSAFCYDPCQQGLSTLM